MATRAATIRGLGVRERVTPRAGLATLSAACLALGLLSLFAPTTPTYDPWAWLIWGREILHLDLNTVSGPSWKPLPVLITIPLGLVPAAAPALWVAVSRAGAITAVALAFRVGRRLGGPAAGLLAAACLAFTNDFLRFSAVGDSEGLIVALLFAAIDLHLSGRRRAAVWVCFAAALLRPESWPFVGLYALWAAWRDPALRKLVAGVSVAGLVLWFGPELWGSGNALRAGQRARDPNPNALAFADHPALEVGKRYLEMLPFPAELGMVAALALAAVRRRVGLPAILALASLAWVGVVAVMTESGFSGNARYLMAPVALACLAGAVGLVELLTPLIKSRAAMLALAVVLLAPIALTRTDDLVHDARAARNEARLMDDLDIALRGAGGAGAVRRCGGTIATGPFQVTALAWRLEAPIRGVGLKPRAPGTVFRAGPQPRPIPGAPPLAVPGHSFRTVARSEVWQVLTTCR